MRTRALRLHGANDLRIDEFDLPEIKDDEILAKVVSDSLCMSSYNLSLPLTAIDDFSSLGKEDSRFKDLDEICGRHRMLWNPEAERYLLKHFQG